MRELTREEAVRALRDPRHGAPPDELIRAREKQRRRPDDDWSTVLRVLAEAARKSWEIEDEASGDALRAAVGDAKRALDRLRADAT